MIINGTIYNIRIERTRSLIKSSISIDCPDYRLEGNFPFYRRFPDFLWQMITTQAIPAARDKGVEIPFGFLMPDKMLPASLTTISDDDESYTDYLLVCMDEKLTTTYHIWFSLSQEMFRRSMFGFHITDVNATINYKGRKRVLKQLPEITDQGFNVYYDLAEAFWRVISDSIAVNFYDTDEDEKAEYIFRPREINLREVAVKIEQKGDRYHIVGTLPDGSYHAEADFNAREDLDS